MGYSLGSEDLIPRANAPSILPLAILIGILGIATTATAVIDGLSVDPDVRIWFTHMGQHQSSTGALADQSFTVTRPHGAAVLDAGSIIEMRANYRTIGGTLTSTIAEFQLNLDGAPVTDCVWRVNEGTQGTSLQFRATPYVSLLCQVPPLAPGLHTFNVTKVLVQGDPITGSTYTFILVTQEAVTTMTTFESTTGLTALEFLLFPALAIAGVILWSRSTDLVVRAFGSFLCMLAGVLQLINTFQSDTTWIGAYGFGGIICLVGIYLLIRLMTEQLTNENATT